MKPLPDGRSSSTVSAWHRVGFAVGDAKSAVDALEALGLDWTVEQVPLIGVASEQRVVPVESHVLNVRTDTGEALAMVPRRDCVLQNKELAAILDEIAPLGSSVGVESIGGYHDGRDVVFMIELDRFFVGRDGGDEVRTYVLLHKSHKGRGRFCWTPVAVRVADKHMMPIGWTPPHGRRGRQFREMGDPEALKEEMREALVEAQFLSIEFEQQSKRMAKAEKAPREVFGYFINVYCMAVEPINLLAETPEEEEILSRGKEQIDEWMSEMFHSEVNKDPETWNTYWAAFQVFSRWFDENPSRRGKVGALGEEAPFLNNLYGRPLAMKALIWRKSNSLLMSEEEEGSE